MFKTNYNTKDEAETLVNYLNLVYGVKLPKEAWGEIDDYLCTAYHAGCDETRAAQKKYYY